MTIRTSNLLTLTCTTIMLLIMPEQTANAIASIPLAILAIF